MKELIKIYDLYLDNKNQVVLMKKLYNQTMNNRELKRLYRTTQIIQKSYVKVQRNSRKTNKSLF